MRFAFSALILLIITSCNHSKYINNDILGKFPSIYAEYTKTHKTQNNKRSAELRVARDQKQVRKINSEYDQRMHKEKLKTHQLATTELQKIKSQTVPFKFDYEEVDFDVHLASIEDAVIETGTLIINLTITTKREISPSVDTQLCYLLMSKDGRYISKGKLNPFMAHSKTTSPDDFKETVLIPGNEMCRWKGTQLALDCYTNDYSSFDRILFVNSAYYNTLK